MQKEITGEPDVNMGDSYQKVLKAAIRNNAIYVLDRSVPGGYDSNPVDRDCPRVAQ